jgi:hypothetical protein
VIGIMHESLQILILVLSVASQLLGLGKKLMTANAGGEAATSGPSHSSQDRPAERRARQKRAPIDLSFVLLCSVFFALLLTDSLLISGRTPSPAPATILIVVLITGSVLVTMCLGWFLGRSELITGCLAVTTLAVLMFSGGGPFFTSESDTVAGLSLLIPTMCLMSLAAAMLIYSFGNPLSPTVRKSTRIWLSLALISIVVFASIALGKSLVTDVITDPRTPKIGQGQTLFQDILHVGLQERREFYRLASEISLARDYQKYFRELNQEQAAVLTNRNTSLNGKTENENLPMNRKNNPAADSTPLKGSSVPSSSTASDVQRPNSDDKEISKADGFNRANFLISHFETSEVGIDEQYLTQRLHWVHPAGLEGQSSATVPLPGTTAEARFEGISPLRIFVALYSQPNLRETVLKEFEYPENIREFFKSKEEKGNSRVGLFGQLETTPPATLFKPTLFPKFDTTVNNSQLKQQLALPLKPEAYVAFKEYQHLATLLVENELNERLPRSDFERLTSTFNSLDDEAQDAFLSYVINNKKVPSDNVYQMLLDLKDIDFEKFATTRDPIAVEKLLSILQGNRANDPYLQDLATKINGIESRQSKEILIELFKNENPELPIKKLFQARCFNLVDQIHKVLGTDKRRFFEAVGDPIWVVAKYLAAFDVPLGASHLAAERTSLDNYLDQFRKLDDQDQGGVLQQLAINLYQPGGPYSLDPLRLLVAEAKSWNDVAGFICATLLALPSLLLCLLIGGFFSERLVARDSRRELIEQELTKYPDEAATFGKPVEVLYGREQTLQTLHKLAERGWSTIGIVGRRGVGKSRILRALLSGASRPSVSAWVAAPSTFEEADFVFSIFERLALSTEATIASYLGAHPISIRKIKHRAALINSWLYVGIVIVLGTIVYEMFSRLSRSDILITWLPILAVALASVGVFVYYLSSRQPVDLSSWLKRDRKQNPHTVILYKEVYDALAVLQDRRRGISTALYGLKGDALRQVAMSGFAMLFSLSIGYLVLSIDNPYSDLSLLLTLLLAGLSCWAWLYLFQRRATRATNITNYGGSIMSLIADYRSFANGIVDRLSKGALGHTPSNSFSVLICIDELDKIVELNEIKIFLRKIKAIFEVPGVYYYVSLAEDTLTSLYLGSASGKNEVDSAFDHIVNIPPLDCATGEVIASEYLSNHGLRDAPTRLTRTIATLAFGVPRDIIRKCDEIIASDAGAPIQPIQLLRDIRSQQADLGYQLHELSKEQVRQLVAPLTEAGAAAQSAISENETLGNERLLLSIWLLCLIERTTTLEDDNEWKQLTEELCALGYRVPADPVGDLRQEINALHRRLFDLD